MGHRSPSRKRIEKGSGFGLGPVKRREWIKHGKEVGFFYQQPTTHNGLPIIKQHIIIVSQHITTLAKVLLRFYRICPFSAQILSLGRLSEVIEVLRCFGGF